MPSAIFDCWDVVVAPYPFVEVLETKQRPMAILTTRRFNRSHGVCFAAMITTARNMTDIHPADIEIVDLAAAGLPRPCVVRTSRLMTVEILKDARRIGRLSESDQGLIRRALQPAFGWTIR
jgi:mRNA-degrading endonuclease toxin of MazEF toxin-antitoxin module